MEHGRLSLWRDTAGLDEATARERAATLELRAGAEDEIAAREEYLRLLDIGPGDRVLDVGCGSGAVTREIARRVAPDGGAVGVDSSPALLAVARELAAVLVALQRPAEAERKLEDLLRERSALPQMFESGQERVLRGLDGIFHHRVQGASLWRPVGVAAWDRRIMRDPDRTVKPTQTPD